MKIIRKYLVLTLSIFMIGSLVPVSAEETSGAGDKTLTYSEKQITDVDSLYNMAESGISDVAENSNDVATVTNPETGEEEFLETMSTTQLVEVKQARNESEETYVKTTFIKEPEPESEVIQTRSSKNEGAYDKTGGVRAYSTVTYTTSSGDGKFTYIKMTKMSGGFSIKDSSIQITSRSVKMNQYGRLSGKQQGVTNTTSRKPINNTFGYSVPNWPAVGRGSIGYDTGVGITGNLKRGTYKWSVNFYNSI